MAYIGAEPDGMGKAQRFTFTASGGETTISVDDNSVPIGYTAGQVRAIKSVKGMNKYSIELSDAEIKDIREMSKIRRGAVEKAINVFITTQIMNKDKRYK